MAMIADLVVDLFVTRVDFGPDEYAEKVLKDLKAAGIRAEIDTRNEKINYKIRDHSHKEVPAIYVVGKREAEEGKVAVRRLGGKDREILALEEAIAILSAEAKGPLAGS